MLSPAFVRSRPVAGMPTPVRRLMHLPRHSQGPPAAPPDRTQYAWSRGSATASMCSTVGAPSPRACRRNTANGAVIAVYLGSQAYKRQQRAIEAACSRSTISMSITAGCRLRGVPSPWRRRSRLSRRTQRRRQVDDPGGVAGA
jgi:hypothetical protein